MRLIYLLEPLDIALRFELPDPRFRLLPLPDRPLRLRPSAPAPPDRGDESPSPLLREAEDRVVVGAPKPLPPLRPEAVGEPADGLLRPLLRDERPALGDVAPALPADGDDMPLRADGPPLPDVGDARPPEGEDIPLRADGPPLLPLSLLGEAFPAEGEDIPLRADGPRLLTKMVVGWTPDGTSEKSLLSPSSPLIALSADPSALRANTDSGLDCGVLRF